MIATNARAGFALLGAGPTGLGAAWRLTQSFPASGNHAQSPDASVPFLLLDQASAPGGRASSVTTAEGFTFDYGGHVLFLHPEYDELLELLNQAVPEWHSSTPVRGVWLNHQLIPTPVQRNIHRLPFPTMAACLWGLWRRNSNAADSNGANSNGLNHAEPSLQRYLEAQFGKALTRHVMAPLNRKMWAHPPETLGSAWSSHRSGSKEKNIPDVSVQAVLRNWWLHRDEPGWTPATRVRYPLRGGTGSMWKNIFAAIPEPYRLLNAKVQGVEAQAKRLHLCDGSTVAYEKLITSIPIDIFLGLLVDQPDLQAKAREFHAARVQIFGLGLEGPMPEQLKGVHAFSVPSPEIPFWRVNIPSNFSPGNVPDPENTWSILCEKSIAPDSTVRSDSARVEAALRGMGLIPPQTKVVSNFSAELAHGYPVPFAGRDQLLNQVQAQLEQLDIFSRGRFGGWRYEVSNQDHSFMQGVEVIDRLLTGKPEYTYQKTW